jgi:hypothetical protein
MSGQLNELRLQVERLNYDSKESGITIDILKEQNEDAKSELEELKKTISELRSSQKDPSADDKEKRKQEKMALMMAKFDTVSFLIPSFPSVLSFVPVRFGPFGSQFFRPPPLRCHTQLLCPRISTLALAITLATPLSIVTLCGSIK